MLPLLRDGDALPGSADAGPDLGAGGVDDEGAVGWGDGPVGVEDNDTVWERVQAETQKNGQEAMSPEVRELLTQMARQQRTVQELKKLSEGQTEGEASNGAKAGF